jgi:hypothetical protein
MSNLVSDKLEQALKENKVSLNEFSNVKKYIEASRLYESMIVSGMTTPRGNNLLSRDKAYNYNINTAN